MIDFLEKMRDFADEMLKRYNDRPQYPSTPHPSPRFNETIVTCQSTPAENDVEINEGQYASRPHVVFTA